MDGLHVKFDLQQWLTPDQFSNTSDSGSIWWHMLVVIVPDKHSTPLMLPLILDVHAQTGGGWILVFNPDGEG